MYFFFMYIFLCIGLDYMQNVSLIAVDKIHLTYLQILYYSVENNSFYLIV